MEKQIYLQQPFTELVNLSRLIYFLHSFQNNTSPWPAPTWLLTSFSTHVVDNHLIFLISGLNFYCHLADFWTNFPIYTPSLIDLTHHYFNAFIDKNSINYEVKKKKKKKGKESLSQTEHYNLGSRFSEYFKNYSFRNQRCSHIHFWSKGSYIKMRYWYLS